MFCSNCGDDYPETASFCMSCGQPLLGPPTGGFSSQPATPPGYRRTDERIYRRVFVGRKDELGQLTAAFAGARSVQGALAMVSGEPGIGKSALCEQLVAHVVSRGGHALVGRCYEEGSLTLPYLPFVEALRSHVFGQEPEQILQELGAGAADVARIIPDLREQLALAPRIPADPSADPDEDRWRLYQAVIAFVRTIAASQPLLLILEDLHWAERGTLDLLVHLARSLEDAPLLLVGTYRNVEVDRGHPLAGALAELGRVARFRRLELAGLAPADVQRMLTTLEGQVVQPPLAEAVYRQTEGNPLFVQEVFRDLMEAEQAPVPIEVTAQDPRVPPWEMRIPGGLRDVVGKRLSRLSSECNQLLTAAAVIGRDFSPDIVQRVAAMDDEAVFAALEAAVRVGLLEERVGPGQVRYRFAHALFRQSLYEDLIAPRRLRLHQRVAQVLEDEYATRREEHAAEIAEHFAQSTDPTDLIKAVAYWRMAARRAGDVYAYAEAARGLEQALSIQKVADPDDRRTHGELLLALADTLGPAGEPQSAAEVLAEEAFRLAEAIGDAPLASEACRIAFASLSRYGGVMGRTEAAGQRWAERADRCAPPGSPARVYADLAIGDAAQMGTGTLSLTAAYQRHRRAIDAARALGEPALLFACAAHWLENGSVGHWEERLQLANDVAALPRRDVDRWTAAVALDGCGAVMLAWGRRERAEELWREVAELGERTNDPAIGARSIRRQITLATLDGRLEDAIETAEQLRTTADQAGRSIQGLQLSVSAGLRAHLYLGRAQEGLDPLERWSKIQQMRGGDMRLGLGLAAVGRLDEARENLDGITRVWPRMLPHSEPNTFRLQQVLELSVWLEDRATAAFFLPLLAPVAHIVNTAGDLACIARHLGAAAALLGDAERAMTYYEQALDVCRRIRFRPEIALIHLGIAELELRDQPHVGPNAAGRRAGPEPGESDLTSPLEHLDFAIQELQAMGMQPALERALALQRDQKRGVAGQPQPVYPGGLSEREVEVLRLIAAGKTNRDIADALFISANTVAHHVTSVLMKTGAANRTEAASYATRHGLVQPSCPPAGEGVREGGAFHDD